MSENKKIAAKDQPSLQLKADVGKRFIAAIIDTVIAFAICIIPLIGGIIGTAYMLLKDGLNYEFMDRRSIGKKMMKLRPVTLDGKEVDIHVSLKRNWMLALGVLIMFLLVIPIFGWVLIPIVALVSLVLGIIEIIFIISKEDGRRLGDKIANTQVIEVEE
ncbi:RDD family protein [candidate division KSB1 bacterium]|nr:RDD family protein [candidate division KSB1 bacterium]